MGVDDVPLDDKAKKMRDLLSSFYSQDPSSANMAATNTSSRFATLDTINTPSFDADQYMNLLVQKSNLEGLLEKHVEMAAEIKNLDTDLQMLVYENYSKFISATDTIKRMKTNIVGMEANMEQLLDKIMSVQSRSDRVNTSLFEKREHVEKLHRTRNLLRKVQFIYDLPSRLGKCIKSEAYADAVKFYTGAMPIFKAYGDSSFQDCKRASEEAVAIITKNLQGKVFSDSESIQMRAEAVMLLKQLNFPVENLKVKLFEKLEQFLVELRLEAKEIISSSSKDSHDPSIYVGSTDSASASAHEASIREFAEAVRAYRLIFPESDQQLFGLAKDLLTKHFDAVHLQIKDLHSADLSEILKDIWSDVLTMNEVLPEAALPDFCFEAARDVIKLYVASSFSRLLLSISVVITNNHDRQIEAVGKEFSFQSVLEASKKAVIQGSMDVLLNIMETVKKLTDLVSNLNMRHVWGGCINKINLVNFKDFHLLLDQKLELLLRLRNFIIDWVQEGFQDFFRKLDDLFHQLSGKKYTSSEELTERMQEEKITPGLVLLVAQLSVFIEQSAIPRITEEIASSFSGGGARGFEYGPAFVPAEICRTFRSAADKLLHLYISMRNQKISVLLRKRFTTPNWVKHKEPREVHMFVDLLLQEVEAVRNEVKQILPQDIHRKHRRTDSNGSTTSSRSNTLRDDRMGRTNTQKARSQLLETHLAKLFKQKMEIFTKVEHTQESVLNTIVKFCLKSMQEFVRLQTFNRRGFQQIQLDMEFLRGILKDATDDEAAIDFLLDEVTVAAAERCLDPIPLDQPILEKLINAKSPKTSEQNPT